MYSNPVRPRERLDLGGTWEASIEGYAIGTVTVPSSYPPRGTVMLSRTVTLTDFRGSRIFLIFEGVAHDGEVFVDNHRIGRLIAFTHHEFDVSAWMGETPVTLQVKLVDLEAHFGNSRGWETYGGIIRPVYLEGRSANFLECPQVSVEVEGSQAIVRARVNVVQNTPSASPVITAVLLDHQGQAVASAKTELTGDGLPGHCTFALAVPQAHLWSPDDPYLYRLVWSLEGEAENDTLTHRVGLRTLSVVGRRFVLNGHRIFLKGVCRHDMWADQGYTLSEDQVRHDLTEIKDLGFNFVRLVHYPHHPQVLDIADEVGLLVTEEPGFWNVRLDDDAQRQAKALALEVLTRMVVRDRTHPSLMAWILGNESWADPSYLHTASSVCRSLDSRPVGFSDLYSSRLGKKLSTKEAYVGWDPDFYDYHPYGEAANLYREAPRYLDDKPLIFGEWGGFWVQHDPWLWERLGQQFAAWAAASDEAASQLAGFAFWQWADMRQYQRGYPGCENGVLTEGLVTEDRQHKPEWNAMRVLLKMIDQGKTHQVISHFDRIADARDWFSGLTPIAMGFDAETMEAHRQAWAAYAPGYSEWTQLPCGFDESGWLLAQSRLGLPPLLSPLSPRLVVEDHRTVTQLVVLGLGDVSEGYPVVNQFGEEALRLTLWGEAGSRLQQPLRHGLEICRQNRLFQGSRIQPLALNTREVFDWVADPDWDVRIVRVWVWSLPHPFIMHRLSLDLVDGHSAVVIHALSSQP